MKHSDNDSPLPKQTPVTIDEIKSMVYDSVIKIASPPFASSEASIHFDASIAYNNNSQSPQSNLLNQTSELDDLLKDLTEQINKLDAKQESFELSKNKKLF